ncbi:MAG: type I DNA topoisomerase, partial [Candidatus Doudnabacteria bacterium]|nr:type I DNA topoisomerase [Candidatus Doudnabacteria bacterium]
FGHIRDLPKSKLSIDTEHDFEPKYAIPPKAKEIVEKLKSLAKHAPEIILASDEDREGESIAWHLVQALGLESSKSQKTNSKIQKSKSAKPESSSEQTHSNTEAVQVDPNRVKRIVFHEITKHAIEEALAHPRQIDQHLVDAQQARRVLDRLVGYELSPFLWRKIRYGLSAGRVQSVAVRLVVERERNIQAFKSEEYWSIEATLSKLQSEQTFTAKLTKMHDKTVGKMDVTSEQQAKNITDELRGATYAVADIQKKEVKRNPAAPFTTSTLQQEAARKFGFSAKQTMMFAQQLYEHGHITYMRTDSLNLAQSALTQAQEVIAGEFGKEYGLEAPRHYTNKSKGAQEAHEAIRPTDLSVLPANLKIGVPDKGHRKLYDLIWKRTLASQMQQAIFDQTTVDIRAGACQFRATGQVVKFDGFIRAYTEGKDEDDTEDELGDRLPDLSVSENLTLHTLSPLQHFTEPPARYSDATLVKALEAHGIGRPSTYAPTLATIQERDYVTKEDKKYAPTEVGYLVNDMLVANFPEIVDINFTAKVEEDFDKIADGETEWVPVIRDFYTPFKKHLAEKEATVEKQVETSTTPCPHCSKMMLIKFGRMGKFLACPDPESKVTLPLPEEAAKIAELTEKTKGEICPICGKAMEVKRGRFGYFLGCVDYPQCKGISKIWNKTGYKCPHCVAQASHHSVIPEATSESASAGHPESSIKKPGSGIEAWNEKARIGDLVEKKGRGRGKPFYACTRWPDCEFIINVKPETQVQLNEQYSVWLENKDKPKATKKFARKTATKKSPTKRTSTKQTAEA